MPCTHSVPSAPPLCRAARRLQRRVNDAMLPLRQPQRRTKGTARSGMGHNAIRSLVSRGCRSHRMVYLQGLRSGEISRPICSHRPSICRHCRSIHRSKQRDGEFLRLCNSGVRACAPTSGLHRSTCESRPEVRRAIPLRGVRSRMEAISTNTETRPPPEAPRTQRRVTQERPVGRSRSQLLRHRMPRTYGVSSASPVPSPLPTHLPPRLLA